MIKIKSLYLKEELDNPEIVSELTELDKKIAIKKNDFLNHFNLNISLIEIETHSFYDFKEILNFETISLFFKNFSFILHLSPTIIHKNNKKKSKLVMKLKDDLSFSISGSNNIDLNQTSQFINNVFSNNKLIIDYINLNFKDLILDYLTLSIFASQYSEYNHDFFKYVHMKNSFNESDLLKYFNFYTNFLKSDSNHILHIPFLIVNQHHVFNIFSFIYTNGKYKLHNRSNFSFFDEEDFLKLFKLSFYFNNQFYFYLDKKSICSLTNENSEDNFYFENSNRNYKLLTEIDKQFKYDKNFIEMYFLNQQLNNF